MTARLREHGSASVYAAVVIGVLALASVVALQLTSVSRLQHQVTAAADLAALAASQAQSAGRDGCRAAAAVADANGSRLVSCSMAGLVATVVVSRRSARMWGTTWSIRRHARAAPSDYVDAAG